MDTGLLPTTAPQEQDGSHSVMPGAGAGHRTQIPPKSPFLSHVELRTDAYSSHSSCISPREVNPIFHTYFKEPTHQNEHSVLTLAVWTYHRICTGTSVRKIVFFF